MVDQKRFRFCSENTWSVLEIVHRNGFVLKPYSNKYPLNKWITIGKIIAAVTFTTYSALQHTNTNGEQMNLILNVTTYNWLCDMGILWDTETCLINVSQLEFSPYKLFHSNSYPFRCAISYWGNVAHMTYDLDDRYYRSTQHSTYD